MPLALAYDDPALNDPASPFNWANLQAWRGHPAPYHAEAIMYGEEPSNTEGYEYDSGPYATQVDKAAVEVARLHFRLTYILPSWYSNTPAL